MSLELELRSATRGVRLDILNLLVGVPEAKTRTAAAGSPVGVEPIDKVGQLCRVGPYAITPPRSRAYDWYVADTTSTWSLISIDMSALGPVLVRPGPPVSGASGTPGILGQLCVTSDSPRAAYVCTQVSPPEWLALSNNVLAQAQIVASLTDIPAFKAALGLRSTNAVFTSSTTAPVDTTMPWFDPSVGSWAVHDGSDWIEIGGGGGSGGGLLPLYRTEPPVNGVVATSLTPATGSFTVPGPATSFELYIGGRGYTEVTTLLPAADIAANAATIINSEPLSEVTAVNVGAFINVTAKVAGVTGNLISISSQDLVASGEFLTGGTAAAAAVTGTAASDGQLVRVGTNSGGVIVGPFTDYWCRKPEGGVATFQLLFPPSVTPEEIMVPEITNDTGPEGAIGRRDGKLVMLDGVTEGGKFVGVVSPLRLTDIPANTSLILDPNSITVNGVEPSYFGPFVMGPTKLNGKCWWRADDGLDGSQLQYSGTQWILTYNDSSAEWRSDYDGDNPLNIPVGAYHPSTNPLGWRGMETGTDAAGEPSFELHDETLPDEVGQIAFATELSYGNAATFVAESISPAVWRCVTAGMVYNHTTKSWKVQVLTGTNTITYKDFYAPIP